MKTELNDQFDHPAAESFKKLMEYLYDNMNADKAHTALDMVSKYRELVMAELLTSYQSYRDE